MVKCIFCKQEAGKYGNSALPVMDGKCCDKCNIKIVLKERLNRARLENEKP